jgi:hypothetical protein
MFKESRHLTNFNISDVLEDRIIAYCKKHRVDKTTFYSQASEEKLGRGEPNPIGITYGDEPIRRQEEPTAEERENIIMHNFEAAFTDLLTITPEMDIDTWTKFKQSIDKRLYATRNPNYKRNKSELIQRLQQ